eukprot:14692145-Ditylum_brightwellii.AAC.1
MLTSFGVIVGVGILWSFSSLWWGTSSKVVMMGLPIRNLVGMMLTSSLHVVKYLEEWVLMKVSSERREAQ